LSEGLVQPEGVWAELPPDHPGGSRLGARRLALPLLLYLISVLLVYAALIPTMSDISGWDEAAPVNAGRLVVEAGTLPVLADGPLTTSLYAMAYHLFRGSVYWLMYGVWFGRLVSYSLLWLSAYLIGRRLEDNIRPYLLVGLFVVAPFALEMLIYPSDPLFAGLSSLALWQLIGYLRSGQARCASWASVFLGLATLARPEGVGLSLVFVLLVAAHSLTRRSLRRALPAALLPVLAIVGGYVLLRGLTTGDFGTGLSQRAYANFETGHGLVFQASSAIDAEVQTHLEAWRVYGTPEENGYSILRAIQRRPDVYLQRLQAAVRVFPSVLLRAYGIRFAPVLFLLALRGMVALLRKDRWLLVACLLWMAPILTGFVLTLFRPGHLLFPFLAVFVLAGFGLTCLVDDLLVRWKVLAWSSVLAAVTLYGFLGNKLAIAYGAGVLLMAVVLARGLLTRPSEGARAPTFPLLLLLCAGLVVHGLFPSPVIRTPGSDPIEASVAYLAEHYAPGTPVAAGFPGIAWAARMGYVGLVDEDVPLRSTPAEFLRWMADQGVQAVFIDRTLFADNPAVWALISPELHHGLVTVFSTSGGDIRIAEIRVGE
jgi:hypothetical protein